MHGFFRLYGCFFLDNDWHWELILKACSSYYLWRQTHIDFIHAPLVFTGALTHLTVSPCSLNLLNIVRRVSIEWTWINNLWCFKKNLWFKYKLSLEKCMTFIHTLFCFIKRLHTLRFCVCFVFVCVYGWGVYAYWPFTIKNNIVNSTMAS